MRNDGSVRRAGPAPASALRAHDFHESGRPAAWPAGRRRAVDTIARVSVAASPRHLYDAAAAWRTEWLAVDGGHTLHVQQFGAPDGLPVLVLHGGPGSGCSPLLPRFCDPRRYRIVCPDQRGAGQSRPAGEVAHNTTAHLLADLRALRTHLQIARWLVVGGSWGATLALAHAADAPDAIAGLLLRSSFLARAQDITDFFDGAAHGQPQAWAEDRALATAQGLSLPRHLHRRLGSADDAERAATALQWWRWEQWLSGAATGEAPSGAALAAQVARLRIQSHYLTHGCWLVSPTLLQRCATVPPVPALLLHGRADRICPPAGAAALHAALPASTLCWIAGAGHDPTHPGMIDAMVCALDSFVATGRLDTGARP
jgi:proline iminopeptidase